MFPTSPRCVVTGAGSGLGREIALQLAGRDARLLLCDVDEAGLAESAEQARALGARVTIERADVRDAAQVEALAARMDRDLGGTDVLVNNAGVAVGGEVGDVPLEDWRWVIDVNLWGVVYGCHSFVPRMRRARSGFVLNVASAAGLLSAPNMGPYNVTKAGVVSLSETLYAETRADGVRVTVLCPGFFDTGLTRTARITFERGQRFVEQQMKRSKVSAAMVARQALSGLEKGELYVLPMAEIRGFWALKRAAPTRFYDLASQVRRRLLAGGSAATRT